MATRIGVISFPGSNCEFDVIEACERLGAQSEIIWHNETTVDGFDALILPGGFAHGDYLRPGAIARFSPVMSALSEFAHAGGPVLGICNGFQVLTEAGLLPGAMMRNAGLRFISKTITCEVVSSASDLTSELSPGALLSMPVNHYEGNYTIDRRALFDMEENGQVILRYIDNPNGSIDAVAGVSNQEGNVVGLMPHPERASSDLLGSVDGNALLSCFLLAGARFGSAAKV